MIMSNSLIDGVTCILCMCHLLVVFPSVSPISRNNPRPWHQNLTEPIASNYYPVVSWIHLQDKRRNIQMTMVPDRPMGGSSLKDGMLELMVCATINTTLDVFIIKLIEQY